jgi:hypothetical protein
MNPRRTGLAAAAAIAAVLAGCGASTQWSPAPKPADWAAVAAYLKAHPAPKVAGMTAGVLVQSSSSSYACLNIVCRTWSGTVVVSASGQTVLVSSDQGDDDLAHVVFPGDYFYFPAGYAPDSAGDVTIIRHGAVSLP